MTYQAYYNNCLIIILYLPHAQEIDFKMRLLQFRCVLSVSSIINLPFTLINWYPDSMSCDKNRGFGRLFIRD